MTNNLISLNRLILLIGIVLIGTSQVNSQNRTNNRDLLIGTWDLDFNKTIKDIKQDSRQYYDSLKVEKKNGIQASFSQRKMSFSSDGRFVLVVNPTKQVTGTWSLEEDEVTLYIVLDNGINMTQAIEDIGNSKLVLNLEKEGVSAHSLFDKWHLKKQ